MLFPVVPQLAAAAGVEVVPCGTHAQVGNSFHVGVQPWP